MTDFLTFVLCCLMASAYAYLAGYREGQRRYETLLNTSDGEPIFVVNAEGRLVSEIKPKGSWTSKAHSETGGST